jgi:flagellar biosynthesis/type III secretory pathway protein FliH
VSSGAGADYDRGYEAGREEGSYHGYDQGYEAGIYEGKSRMQDEYEMIDRRLTMLIEFLNTHYPNAMEEFEKSTAVAERMERV